MPKQSLITLKNWFKRGLKPLESQFSDWLDSFWHKDSTDIPVASIQNLQSILNDLATITAVTLKEDKANKGIANGYASLDATIKVPLAQLQHAVDLLRDGVPSAGDTLNKLYILIQNVTGVSPPEAFSAASGAFPTTYAGLPIKAGSSFRITAPGTLGALNQKTVGNEDLIIALVHNPTNNGNDWQAIESNRELATNAVLGLVKLYSDLAASNTDGTVTQAAIVTALGLKANLASPAFTGTPTAPTATPGTNTTQLATTAFVKAADDLKLNKGVNTEYETIVDGSDEYTPTLFSRLGIIFKSSFLKWNETLQRLWIKGDSSIIEIDEGTSSGNAIFRFLSYTTGNAIAFIFQDSLLNPYLLFRSSSDPLIGRAVVFRQPIEYDFGKGFIRETHQRSFTTPDNTNNNQYVIFEYSLNDGQHLLVRVTDADATATDDTSISSLGIDVADVRKIAGSNIEGNTNISTQSRLGIITTGGFNWNIDTVNQKIQFRFQNSDIGKIYEVFVEFSIIKRIKPTA